MPYFENLRVMPWEPSFTWVETATEAADQINSFHEDYPRRVAVTESLLELPFRGPWTPARVPTQEVHALALSAIHWFLFQQDAADAGQLRKVDVRVGNHRPPNWELVPKLMGELQQRYLGKIDSVEALQEYYYDFETIHPFPDGNGRVGGIIVATFAHAKHPDKGWLAVNQ